jgi:hypothetical protein
MPSHRRARCLGFLKLPNCASLPVTLSLFHFRSAAFIEASFRVAPWGLREHDGFSLARKLRHMARKPHTAEYTSLVSRIRSLSPKGMPDGTNSRDTIARH